MTYFQAFILGIIQGITEFLPISSSGHLTVLQHVFGLQEPPLFFNIAVHAGTLIATLIFFRKLIWSYLQGLFNKDRTIISIIITLIVASIPAAVAGIIFELYLADLFNSLMVVSMGFMVTAFFLWRLHINLVAQRTNQVDENTNAVKEDPALKDAIIIGLYQALAILPGITRSGSTILAGTTRKLRAENAFDFSFLLSIPAITGALLLQILSFETQQAVTPEVIGGITAAGIGYLSLYALKKVVTRGNMLPFAVYCFILSLVTFLYALT